MGEDLRHALDLDLLDRYERMWEFEMEAREHLTARLQLAMGLLSALGAALAYWIFRIEEVARLGPRPAAIVGLLLAASIALAALAGRHLIKCFTEIKYGVVPTAEDLERFRSEHVDYYRKYPKTRSPGQSEAQQAREELLKYLLNNYIKMQSVNAHLNERRYEELHLATRRTFWGLALCAIASLIFGLAAWAGSQS